MELGKYIKDTIKSQGRAIAWVSDQLGFNERTFAGKLNRNSITGEDLIRVSDLLGIDLEQLKKEMLTVKKYPTVLVNGDEVDYESAVNMMDDDIREELHSKLAPCADQEFMDAYIKAHFEKYNEEFVLN